jgi:hypothetical protein
MSVKISYFRVSQLPDSLNRLFPGVCLAAETISSFPTTGSYVATELIMAVLVSSETVNKMAAHGTTPVATTTTATATSGAGYGIPPSQQVAVLLLPGDKIAVADFA